MHACTVFSTGFRMSTKHKLIAVTALCDHTVYIQSGSCREVLHAFDIYKGENVAFIECSTLSRISANVKKWNLHDGNACDLTPVTPVNNRLLLIC